MAENNESQVVIDQAKSSISDLWKKEDYWAIWLGFLLFVIGMMIYMPLKPENMYQKIDKANEILKAESEKAPFKTIAWHQAVDDKKKLKAEDSNVGKKIKGFLQKPQGWSSNPMDSLFMTKAGADASNLKAMPKFEEAKAKEDELLSLAKAAESVAESAAFKDESLNTKASDAIDAWRMAKTKTSDLKKKTTKKAYNLIPSLIGLTILLGVFFCIGIKFMGLPVPEFLKGFPFIFFIAVLAYIIASQSTVKHYGVEYAAWAVILGLIISNTVGTPKWVMPAVQTEYYIKTGLVLLGGEVLFGKILAIGIPGIFVAWVVTPVVLISTYYTVNLILNNRIMPFHFFTGIIFSKSPADFDFPAVTFSDTCLYFIP